MRIAKASDSWCWIVPRINQELLERMEAKLHLSRRRLYELIDEKVRTAHLPRHLAAIAVAAERGVNISRFASTEELAEIRSAARAAVPSPVVVPEPQPAAARGINAPGKLPKRKTTGRRRGNSVFVVHGRNLSARDALFAFLRSLGLKPIEWTQAIRMTKQASPYVGTILETAFKEAAAVVVLFTPDDEARLRVEFRLRHDQAYERDLTGQARPNVLFEAGMAFGKNPSNTVLVQMGEMRPFSDIAGRHILHLSSQPTSRQELATKLANAGCNVDTSGSDWLTVGNFEL